MIRILWAALAIALMTTLCAVGYSAGPEADGTDGRAPVVTVLADGKIYRLQVSAPTVGDLLERLEITLGPLDRTSPSPATELCDGMLVRVTRVVRRREVEEVVVPSRVVVLADPERPAGFTKVLKEGCDGRIRRVFTIWEKDGKETQRTVSQEEVLAEAEDTVILRGTYGLTTRGGNWRTAMRMVATGYDPGPRSCGRFADGYTATGMKAQKGVVAVDPKVIPMGTRLYIPGYGFAIAADRGSAIKGMRIDLCFNTYREARQFGRREIDVYLLD